MCHIAHKWACKGYGNRRHLFKSIDGFATGDSVCGQHAFDATKDWMDWNAITPQCVKCARLTRGEAKGGGQRRDAH